jgi:hypothetical protein
MNCAAIQRARLTSTALPTDKWHSSGGRKLPIWFRQGELADGTSLAASVDLRAAARHQTSAQRRRSNEDLDTRNHVVPWLWICGGDPRWKM